MTNEFITREYIVNIDEYNNTSYDNRFAINDTIEIIKSLELDVEYIEVLECRCSNKDISNEDKVKELQSYISNNRDDKKVVLLINYISTEDYGSDEYYIFDNDKSDDKILLPVDEILNNKDNLEILKNNNFESINRFVNYEYKEPFILLNYFGKKVYKKFELNYLDFLEKIKERVSKEYNNEEI